MGDQTTLGSVGPEPDTTCYTFLNERCELNNATHPPLDVDLRFPGRWDLKDLGVRSVKCEIV